MTSQYSFLNSLTYEQRIAELGSDADVIIPATRIYLNAMKWSGARQIYVPKIGLSDGIEGYVLRQYINQSIFLNPKKNRKKNLNTVLI
jgi:hypothetical protein